MQLAPLLFSIPFTVSVFCVFLLTLNGYTQGILYLSPKVSFSSGWSELSSEFILYVKLHIHCFTFIYIYFHLPFSHPATESCKELLQFVTMYFILSTFNNSVFSAKFATTHSLLHVVYEYVK